MSEWAISIALQKCKFLKLTYDALRLGRSRDKGFKEHSTSPHFKKWEEYASSADAFSSKPEVNFAKII